MIDINRQFVEDTISKVQVRQLIRSNGKFCSNRDYMKLRTIQIFKAIVDTGQSLEIDGSVCSPEMACSILEKLGFNENNSTL